MKNEYRIWLADRLKHFRELHKFSQREIAQYLKMKLGTYQSYEEKRSRPGVHVIKQLCKKYSISVDYFLEGSPEPAEAY